MLLNGIPIVLENLLMTLTDQNRLISWKTFGDLKSTTLVLKFDCEQSSNQPSSYRRKPPSSVNRDTSRASEYRAQAQDTDSATAKVDTCMMTEPTNYDFVSMNGSCQSNLSGDCSTVTPRTCHPELGPKGHASGNIVKSTSECMIRAFTPPPPPPAKATGISGSSCNIDMLYKKSDKWAICKECVRHGLAVYVCVLCIEKGKHQEHADHMGELLVPWEDNHPFCWGCGRMCKNKNSIIYICAECPVMTCEACHIWMHTHHRDQEEKKCRHELIDYG